jgi:hypothetical protein
VTTTTAGSAKITGLYRLTTQSATLTVK